MKFFFPESAIQWVVTIGFFYPLLKAIFIKNRPTFSDPPKAENHRNRLKTAAFYVWWVPCSAVFAPPIFLCFMFLTVWCGLGEYCQAVIPKRSGREEAALRPPYDLQWKDRVLQVAGVVYIGCAYFGGVQGMTFGTTAAVLLLTGVHIIYLIAEGYLRAEPGAPAPALPADAVQHLAYYMFGFVWVAWTLGHSVVLYSFRQVPHPEGYLILLLAAAWIGDAAAYYVGSRIGRTKIMPSVSPNKSLEGAVAEVLMAFIICMLFKTLQINYPTVFFFFPPISFLDYGVIAMLAAVGGIIGDALESLIKRHAHVKDSGTFFTGHGGILDRFDTFFFNSLLVFYYLYFFLI